MMNKKPVFSLIVSLLVMTGAIFAAGKTSGYAINKKKSKITFYVDAKLENVTGEFHDFYLSEFYIDKDDLESMRGAFKIKVRSLKTGKTKRDRHMYADDFFDAKKYPEITVKVSEVEHDDEEDYEAAASITIKGTTKQFVLPVEISKGKKNITVTGKFYINRKDFGVNGNIVSNAIVEDNAIARFTLVLQR